MVKLRSPRSTYNPLRRGIHMVASNRKKQLRIRLPPEPLKNSLNQIHTDRRSHYFVQHPSSASFYGIRVFSTLFVEIWQCPLKTIQRLGIHHCVHTTYSGITGCLSLFSLIRMQFQKEPRRSKPNRGTIFSKKRTRT